MAFHGFSWFQPKNGPCLTNSSFKLRLDSNASASGLLTLAVRAENENVETSTPPHPPHPRPKGQCRTKRSNQSRWSNPRLAHVSTHISESQTFYQFLSDISVCSLLFQYQISYCKMTPPPFPGQGSESKKCPSEACAVHWQFTGQGFKKQPASIKEMLAHSLHASRDHVQSRAITFTSL